MDRVSAAHVSSGRAVSCSGRTWNQARAGTGPDQRRRLGIAASWCLLRHCKAVRGMAWSGLNRHHGRRGEASTPRGGMRTWMERLVAVPCEDFK